MFNEQFFVAHFWPEKTSFFSYFNHKNIIIVLPLIDHLKFLAPVILRMGISVVFIYIKIFKGPLDNMNILAESNLATPLTVGVTGTKEHIIKIQN